MTGELVVESSTLRALGNQWVRRSLTRRRALVLLALIFSALGPAMTLLVTGVMAQLAPPVTHTFGHHDHIVEWIPMSVAEQYVGAAQSLGLEAGAYCDLRDTVNGTSARVRAVAGAPALTTVGLDPAEFGHSSTGWAAISAPLSDALGTSPGAVVNVAGVDSKLISVGAINPESVGDFVAVVPLGAIEIGDRAEDCTAVLSGSEDAGVIWAELRGAIPEATHNSLAAFSRSRSEDQIRSVWAFGTALSLIAGGSVAVSIWGLIVPGLSQEALALVVLVINHYSVDRGWGDEVPYISAVVELDEGPRVIGHLHGVEPGGASLGQAVQVVVEPRGDDFAFLRVDLSH